MAMGVAFMVRARLGLGPWDVLHQGLSDHTGIPIGTVGVLLGLPVFLLWIPLHQRPGVGTVVNAATLGFIIDITLAVTDDPATLPWRWVWLIAGVLMIGIGASLYIGAGLGPGPRDGLMTGLAARGHSVRVVRTVIEVLVLSTGWLLGGTIGVGTVLFAFGIGPIMHLALPWFDAGPLLNVPGE